MNIAYTKQSIVPHYTRYYYYYYASYLFNILVPKFSIYGWIVYTYA